MLLFIGKTREERNPIKKKKSKFRLDKEKFYFIRLGTTKPSLRKKLRLWYDDFGLHCIAVIRLGQWANQLSNKNKVIGLLPRAVYHILNKCMQLIHKVYIPSQIKIGAGFHIAHPLNILIGPSRIGSNCNIFHDVTIRAQESLEGVKINTIGNNVWIGPGAIILGNIDIGDGATVSAGSVLSKSVPEKCLVAGNPARIIKRNYDNKYLLFNLNNPKYYKYRGIQSRHNEKEIELKKLEEIIKQESKKTQT